MIVTAISFIVTSLPESILLDRKGHVKNFAYFKEGIAKGDKVNGFCGTIPYMAPEIMHYRRLVLVRSCSLRTIN
ncbi:unnamed protein product [Gordionus sp. m RMFG-2023]